jgi:hypothetical protein
MTPERTLTYSPGMDEGERVKYQLLDHATEESPLWDVRRGITTSGSDNVVFLDHRDRTPEELIPELEQLLRDRHVALYEMADPERAMTTDEAIAVIRDERHWYFSPPDPPSEKPTGYCLFITDTGLEAFRRVSPRKPR